MPGMTFNSIIEGKESYLQEKLMIDDDLLSRLKDYEIITHNQDCKIKVFLLLFASFSRIL